MNRLLEDSAVYLLVDDKTSSAMYCRVVALNDFNRYFFNSVPNEVN